MAWRCAECDRAYDEPPETCVCGSVQVEPIDDEADEGPYSLLALRERLLHPKDADRSLVRDEPYVTILFRLLFAVAILGSILIAVRLVL